MTAASHGTGETRRNLFRSVPSCLRGPRSGWTEDDTFVQAAHSVPARIDGDLPIPERLDGGDDTRGEVRLEGAGQLVGADFHACHVVVMADAADTEAEVAQ